ncbi:YDG domain-containing protein, partial [Rhodanobacter sp. ANJX3]|uniref:beta strand repeat-containing protein n=1 Tax=Rhodanobacter sp. ANJX3 TaxID=2723083 RepID=UPI001C8449AD
NNETSSVLGGSLVYGGTSQGAINAGNYGITASGLSSNNYTISYVDGALDVGKAALTVTAQDASKTYDGLAYSGGNGVTYSGLVNNETSSVLGGSLVYGGTSQGAINAGNYGITASGLSSNNYAISYVDGALDVGKAILNLAGTRVYDGTTNADAGALTTISGLVGNETVVISGTGEVGDKNVGTNKALTGLGNLALADGSNGGLAGNYTLAGGIDTLTITPKAITVAATAADKTYDGNATAVVTSLTSSGIVGNDTVDFADTAGTFSDANAGTGKTVTVGGITANGTDAGNYTVNNTATTTANIDKAVLNLSGTRVYDADTDANAKLLAISGLVGNETVVLSGVGQVGDKNVGTDKPFANLDTLALADGSNGGLAGNYTLVGGTDTLTITPATLTVAGTTVGTKTYDGNTTASLGGSTLKGLLGSDSVALGNDATGTFASANAGTESVTTGMTIGGTDAGNYIIVQPSGLVGTINPYVLDLSGTRVYDGTTNAVASAFGNGGLLTGINGETVNLGGTGQVGDKNVGSDKLFTSLGSLTLSDGSNGGLAGNYTLVGGVDTLSITPKTLVADATGTSKIYNGSTLDTVTLGSPGVVAGDSVQFGYGTANFSDPTIGSDKLVTVTGVQLSGADAGNYLLASPTVYTQANITGAQASAFGISNGTLASVDSVLNSKVLATPYGLAAQESVGTFIGNKKRLHRPVERNVSRGDFSSGLALKVIDGGVRPPAQALP